MISTTATKLADARMEIEELKAEVMVLKIVLRKSKQDLAVSDADLVFSRREVDHLKERLAQ